MNPIKFSLGEIGQVEVLVRNVELAVKFYSAKLGLHLLYSGDESAVYDCNGVRLMLSKSISGMSGSVIYFEVEDINCAYEFLCDRGVKFIGSPKIVANLPDYILSLAFFYDLDNNLLALMSEQTVNAARAVTSLDLLP
jgi:Glyoxalase/Bleomycin resistance protein/Dioxygenase superfamily.